MRIATPFLTRSAELNTTAGIAKHAGRWTDDVQQDYVVSVQCCTSSLFSPRLLTQVCGGGGGAAAAAAQC